VTRRVRRAFLCEAWTPTIFVYDESGCRPESRRIDASADSNPSLIWLNDLPSGLSARRALHIIETESGQPTPGQHRRRHSGAGLRD